MIKLIALVILAELFTAVGQIFLKKSANAMELHTFRSVHTHIRFLKDVFAKPLIWLAFVSMAIGLVIWLVALAQGDLSLVFSIGSLQYILILVSAHFFLNEKIDRMKLLGTLLVIVGITLITMS